MSATFQRSGDPGPQRLPEPTSIRVNPHQQPVCGGRSRICTPSTTAESVTRPAEQRWRRSLPASTGLSARFRTGGAFNGFVDQQQADLADGGDERAGRVLHAETAFDGAVGPADAGSQFGKRAQGAVGPRARCGFHEGSIVGAAARPQFDGVQLVAPRPVQARPGLPCRGERDRTPSILCAGCRGAVSTCPGLQRLRWARRGRRRGS